jgi:hypothetical protein
MRESRTYGSVRGALSNERPYRDERPFVVAIGVLRNEADPLAWAESDAHDPFVWSGRAVQEVSSTLADAVLHQCIRPLIGAS